MICCSPAVLQSSRIASIASSLSLARQRRLIKSTKDGERALAGCGRWEGGKARP